MPIDCTHDDIIDAIAGVISGLALDNMGTPTRVYASRYPDDRQMTFPCIVVSVEGETEQLDERVNVGTDWDYPTRVFFADSDRANTRAKLKQELTWRQQLADAFHMKTPFLGLLPDVYRCKVVPHVIYDSQQPNYQHVVSGMVVWSKVRVVRGTRDVPQFAPKNLVVAALNRTLELNWSRVPFAEAYNVYRGTLSGGESLIASEVAAQTYEDLEAVLKVTYFYQVSATNVNGETSRSLEAVGAAQSVASPGCPLGAFATNENLSGIGYPLGAFVP
jgi:hypothetical protein